MSTDTPSGPVSPSRRPTRVDTRTLRADLRRLLIDVTAALVVTVVIFVVLYWRVDRGTSPTVEVMPDLDDARQYWLYWACQAFGWSALLWAWVTVMLGLLRSSAPGRWSVVPHARIERWHRVTSLTTVGLMFAHAFAFFLELLRDNEESLTSGGLLLSAFVDVFVPGGYGSGTGQVAILLGLIAFYLAFPLSLAFYVRSWTGNRLWRALHRFVIVVYVLSVWHTLLYGTNVWFDGWFRTVVWALQLPVAVLLLTRLLSPLRPEERFGLTDLTGTRWWRALIRLGARISVAITVVVLLLVTVTGRDGGRTRGEETGEMLVTQEMIWGGLAVFLAVVVAVALAVRERRGSDGKEPIARR